MMKKINILFILVAVFSIGNVKADVISFFKDTDIFMKKYVNAGRVNYRDVKINFTEVESLYREVGVMNLSGSDENTKKAFYLNAYNIIVIYQVSKFYPLKSPMDQSGFFDRVKYKVAGENITLNELEIKKIILKYKDPRIHFALACGAISCPELASFAYQPISLNEQLEARTKKAINDPEFIQVSSVKNTVKISEIFKWYQRDFTTNGGTVMEFINQYRISPIPNKFKLEYYEYNWNLNEM
ncbi:MAG: DUF547 domain-containing protein [Cyclobacteriaceae bacterium]|nr:DUF547 domain-containing protein [Cyclobacteriaceae bacterium]